MNKCIGENRLTYLWGKIKAFVSASYAPLASPALTGTPTAPTATSGTNTTQIATTAFVKSAIADKADAATTLAGYGITDAKIESGVITLGSNTITPQTTSGLVTSVSSSSTDTQYPSAKCVYDLVGDIETLLAAI